MKLTVTVTGDTAKYLKLAAKRDKVALEKKAARLLKLGLETEEDMLLAKLALKEMKKDGEYISSEEFWEKAL